VDDVVKLEAELVRLERDLHRADDIAESPEAMFGGATRYEVGDLTFGAEALHKSP
jgi:hypothetical protein